MGKKKEHSSSEDNESSMSGSDIEFSKVGAIAAKEKTTSRRAAAKPLKYNLYSDDSDEEQQLSKNSDLEQNDVQGVDSSDSDVPPPKQPQKTSKNMCDLPIGNCLLNSIIMFVN